MGRSASAMPRERSCEAGIAPDDYAELHRRGHAARVVSEGAVLQAARVSRRHLSGRPAGTHQRGQRLWHSTGRCRVAGISPALRTHAAQRVPVSLRPADRGAVCPGADEDAAGEPEVTDTHVRANAGVNALEGVGIIEAPRGTLIHHYKVDENGAIVWANLIVATGHNNLAIGKSVRQVSEHFVKGNAPGGRHAESRVCRGARLRSVPELLDPCRGNARRQHLPGWRRRQHYWTRFAVE